MLKHTQEMNNYVNDKTKKLVLYRDFGYNDKKNKNIC